MNHHVVARPKIISQNGALISRPGTVEDSYAVFAVFEQTLADLSQRLGSTGPTSWQDPEALARMWTKRRSLYEHLARTAEQFWVAERNGGVVGFARSIERGGLRQLTEFFVAPAEQSNGIGRELINRVFPREESGHRCIIATADSRAQSLYLKAGVYPRFPIYYFEREAEVVAVESDLTFEPIIATPGNLETIAAIDQALFEHRRDIDHIWLSTDRQGYLYYRAGRPVGYGYIGRQNGPFALLNNDDFPAVLAHAESQAAKHQRKFGIETPMINKAAVDYLLARGYKLDWFIAIFMSNKPFGKFENYIVTSPPFFL